MLFQDWIIIFTLCLVSIYIGKYGIEKDNQFKILLFLAPAIILIALALLAPSNYRLIYDTNLGTFVKFYPATEDSSYYIYFWMPIIISIVSGALFILAVSEEWRKRTIGKEAKRDYHMKF